MITLERFRRELGPDRPTTDAEVAALFEQLGVVADVVVASLRSSAPRAANHDATQVCSALHSVLALKTLTLARELSGRRPADFDGRVVVAGIYDTVEGNWRKWRDSNRSSPSAENWVLRRVPEVSPGNKSQEVILERAIAQAQIPRWWNQMPVASGVTDPNADGRAAIDLVFERSATDFDVIELKVANASESPVAAAFQIVRYAVAWAFSRVHARALGYDTGERRVLGARRLSACVLAPADFYIVRPRRAPWVGESVPPVEAATFTTVIG